MTTPPDAQHRAHGFSLVELVISMALMAVVLSGVFTVLVDATRANDTVRLSTQTNNNLRVAMDLLVRDVLQAGQGLPTGRVVGIPSGAGAVPVRRPGPLDPTNDPDTIVAEFDSDNVALPAVTSGPDLGPAVAGQPTDMITLLAADSAFEGVPLTQVTNTSITVVPTVVINDSPDAARDNIQVGDLIMLTKQSMSTLKYVTGVVNNTVQFAANDPLDLNQPGAAVVGTLAHYASLVPEVAKCPVVAPGCVAVVPSVATRIRMVTYYLDPVDNGQGLRLMRRINSRPPTVVAFSMERLAFTFDIVDDEDNPTDVALDAADLDGTGRCAPLPCSPNQARKVNVALTGRSARRHPQTGDFLRSTLSTQVSLRALALVDRYS